MRTGILSDDFIRSTNPAFFPDRTPRKRAPRTRVIKRPVIPYYDLYATARLTMDNPFDGARELILNYVPGEAVAPVAAPVAQAAPAAELAATPAPVRQPRDDDVYRAQYSHLHRQMQQNTPTTQASSSSDGSPVFQTPAPRQHPSAPRQYPSSEMSPLNAFGHMNRQIQTRFQYTQQRAAFAANEFGRLVNNMVVSPAQQMGRAVGDALSPRVRGNQVAPAPPAPQPFGDLQ